MTYEAAMGLMLPELKLELVNDQQFQEGLYSDSQLTKKLNDVLKIGLHRVYWALDMEPPLDENGQPSVPYTWTGAIVRGAVELINKIGIEGEIAHQENGTNRSFAGAELSTSILKEFVGKVGVL